jgi:hypothetical protein
MTLVQCSRALEKHRWCGQWQRVALWYRVREHAAVLDAICAMDPNYLTMQQDDWMIMAQSVSRKEATLLKLFLSHPEDMHFCPESGQLVVFPIRDLRGIARCLREVAPQAPKAMIGRMILDLADPPTLGALHLVLTNPFDILPQRRHPVLLDVA